MSRVGGTPEAQMTHNMETYFGRQSRLTIWDVGQLLIVGYKNPQQQNSNESRSLSQDYVGEGFVARDTFMV